MTQKEVNNNLTDILEHPLWRMSVAVIHLLVVIIGTMLYAQLKDLNKKDVQLENRNIELHHQINNVKRRTSVLEANYINTVTRLNNIESNNSENLKRIENKLDNLNTQISYIFKNYNKK